MTSQYANQPHTPPAKIDLSKEANLDLGIIGNGTIAAIIDPKGAYQWMCLPRFDGEPVIDTLLGGSSSFSVELENLAKATQHYNRNTATLITTLTDTHGAVIEITDFAPRFTRRNRRFRPMNIVRRIRPVSGTARIRIRAEFSSNWGEALAQQVRGVSHISYKTKDNQFRLSTNAPIDYIVDRTSFRLESDIALILGPDETIAESLLDLAREWDERTGHYWRDWSRSLAVPYEWQEAVIRAAISLKLCVYEETGGIIAALTTSIPEHEGSERNWDYRYCWLRDSYFVVTALNRLASMSTLEHYVRWVRNITAASAADETKDGFIQPVFGIGLEETLTEHIVETLPGYRGHGPVRRGNQAHEHVQHDVYGQVVLSAAQAFFDTRLLSVPTCDDFHDLEAVGDKAYAVHNTPDAGIWEFRGLEHVHTSSAIMCWAACDRLSRIACHLDMPNRETHWQSRAEEIKQTILDNAFNEELNAFTAAYGGKDLDASVLLMAEIGFIDPMDERYIGTVDAIDKTLREGNFVFRYKMKDDFGTPETSFTACTFWFIDALWRIGRKEDARKMFNAVLENRNHLGLMSEDLNTETKEMWGNFPQTYSLVGIINSASLLSENWSNVI